MTYRKWIVDEGTWSEFVPQAEGENQREKKLAEREIIVDKYGQRYKHRLGGFWFAQDNEQRKTSHDVYGAAATTRNDADAASDESGGGDVTRGEAGEGSLGSGAGGAGSEARGAGSGAGANVESTLQELLLEALNLLNKRLQPSPQNTNHKLSSISSNSSSRKSSSISTS